MTTAEAAAGRQDAPSLFSVVPGFYGTLILLVLFSALINLMIMAMPIYTLQLFDRVLGSRSIETLVLLSVAVGLVLVMHVCIDLVRSRILQRLGARFELHHNDAVLEASLLHSARNYQASAQPLRDLVEIKQAFSSPGIVALLDAPWAPLFLVVTFVLHPAIGFLTLGGIVLIFLIAAAHAAYVSAKNKALNKNAISAFENMQDYADNADVLVAMGMRDNVCRSWTVHAKDLLKRQMAMQESAGLFQSSTKFLRMVLQVAVMGIGCLLVLQLELSPGAMIAGSILMARALAPAEQAMSAWRTVSSAKEAVGRLKALFQEIDAKRPGIEIDHVSAHLELERVSFGMRGSTNLIIQPTSLQVEGGTVLGVIGPSGSGKSTLARLMVGILEPSTGVVRLDGADVTRRAVFDLGKHIGYLPQDVQLFHGTVSENIARLSDVMHEEDVRAAARLAGVERLINSLPNSYETVIGRSAVRLSAGQQQRIGLARAVFELPAIVVLDEPDANLDPEGIDCLKDVVAALKENGSIVILISHRPAVLAMASRVVLVRNGRIEADGPPRAVLQNMGVSLPRQSETPLIAADERRRIGSGAANGDGEPSKETDASRPQPMAPSADSPRMDPVPVSDWPLQIKQLWRGAHARERLPEELDRRREFAIAIGQWVAFTSHRQIGVDASITPDELPILAQAFAVLNNDVLSTNGLLVLVSVLRILELQESATSIELAIGSTEINRRLHR